MQGSALVAQLRRDPSMVKYLTGALTHDRERFKTIATNAAIALAESQGVDTNAQLQYNMARGSVAYIDALLTACKNGEEP